MKDQLVINGDTKQIIGIYEEKGAVHDLEIFKRSGVNLLKDLLLIGDRGYQDLKLYHSNSFTAYKKPKTALFLIIKNGLILKFHATEFISNTLISV